MSPKLLSRSFVAAIIKRPQNIIDIRHTLNAGVWTVEINKRSMLSYTDNYKRPCWSMFTGYSYGELEWQHHIIVDMVWLSSQLVEDADDKLFQSVLHNPEHTLYQLLPERRRDITYSLWPRRYDLTLSRRPHCIFDCNFIVRQLLKDSHNDYLLTLLHCVQAASWELSNKIILYCIVLYCIYSTYVL